MENRLTTTQQEHLSTSEKVYVLLSEAVKSYETEITEALAKPRVSTHEVNRIDASFNDTVEQLQNVSLPHNESLAISAAFMHEALGEHSHYSRYGRTAAANIGMSFSGPEHDDARAEIAKSHYAQAMTSLHRSGDAKAMERAEAAYKVLSDLQYEVEVVTVPSHAQNFAVYTKNRAGEFSEYAQKNARKTAIAGAGVLLVTGIVTPSMAQAAQPLTIASSVSTQNNVYRPAGQTAIAVNVQEEKAPSAALKISVDRADARQLETKVSVSERPGKTSAAPLSVGSYEASTKTAVNTAISVVSEKPDVEVHSLTIAPNVAPKARTADTVVAVPDMQNLNIVKTEHTELKVSTVHTDVPTTQELAGMNKQQKAIELIKDAIQNDTADTSMTNAASLIRLGFPAGSEQGMQFNTSNGQSTEENAFYDAIIDRQIDLQDTLNENGHADGNYVNNSLISLAVLEVVSENQSILDSPDIQKLIADIKKPSDEYQGKLFDQYLAKAKQALEADNGKLLNGIDEKYRPQVETMYAYSLMSIATDAEQATHVQEIKDAEAKAAAEKKAAEEAAAAAKASQAAEAQHANNGDIGTEAFKSLIENAPSPVAKRMFMAMQHFMNNGFTSYQAAGMVGNMHKESGSTMDPSIEQFGGGPGRGMVQWEVGGRFEALKAFAAERGTSWDDFDTQLDFVIHEMQTTRSQAYAPVKDSKDIYGASYAFMRYFETPYVVIQGLNTGDWSQADAEAQDRTGRGQPLLDAFNHQVDAITQARADAAEKAKDLQEKQEKENGLNLQEAIQFVANYKNDPNNVQYTGGASQQCNGGPLSNCVSFSVYFANKYTNIGGMGNGTMPGNGSIVVQNIADRNPNIKTGHTPEVNAIFSTPSGVQMCGHVKCGHTGVILGVDKERGVVIVGEAGCGTEGWWDTAREYPYDRFNSEMYTYAYTDGWIKAQVQ